MKKYFVFGDAHSYFSILQESLAKEGFDLNNPEHILISLGDNFDRGEESVEMYNFLKEMLAQNRLIWVRGNHEDLLFDCVKELRDNEGCTSIHHYSNGTVKTVTQFQKAQINIDEVLRLIDENAIDYYTLGKYIFVHGWVPYVLEDDYDPDQSEDEFSCVMRPKVLLKASSEMWKRARWDNGMASWKMGATIRGKTIVCGHFHTSFGNYKYHKKGSGEFETDSDFSPFVDKGIIALDSCVAWTKQINVLVINEEEL